MYYAIPLNNIKFAIRLIKDIDALDRYDNGEYNVHPKPYNEYPPNI